MDEEIINKRITETKKQVDEDKLFSLHSPWGGTSEAKSGCSFEPLSCMWRHH
jgi:hypothetical protein